ncbi:MAG: hypothetical protein [Wendovervirus sonii]|uniref:Uncharacterized protein n=1 Tax=phage Lak_Megaphage_Sonny TaxID=3109229 RepID=A0ABZ0Z2C5_9CAUD|nr:MAG: hypothetical protein [phage Lak_Megaphage_Sonny]
MEVKTFSELDTFYKFIEEYNGNLRIQKGKVYEGSQLIAQCTYRRNK